ncbi:MAG: LysR family transcriptional regulator [Chroococcidiopsidaceae cyanobacterium CP_BM_RX_35]|nr:LysR family transcriptional regulator [Chroococcidiopsidaceae cyanobacterium CP_BM_RX_35]
MELRHLRYFITVAEELHFSRAAEKLQIAQPPLSQQIRYLEEELGVQLFEHTKRRVQLTYAGQVFLLEARRVLTQLEQAVMMAQRASRGEIGRLGVGVNATAAQSFLPEILRVFRERFPDVKLVLHELASHKQAQGIREDHIDIGFLSVEVDVAR